jgi:hypothetical protein
MARAALDDFLRRYRRVWRQLHQQSLHVLHWPVVGRVWAIDLHGPRPAVDGLYPHLLAVRDLSSGQQLLWLPVADATATTVSGGSCEVLESRLFPGDVVVVETRSPNDCLPFPRYWAVLSFVVDFSTSFRTGRGYIA